MGIKQERWGLTCAHSTVTKSLAIITTVSQENDRYKSYVFPFGKNRTTNKLTDSLLHNHIKRCK